MPHVGKRKVKKKIFIRMSEEFIAVLSAMRSIREVKTFADEFFTPTERIMFSKRFAAILMIQNGYSFSAVERTLKLSPSTVFKIWQRAKRNEFHAIAKHNSKNKASKKFWEDLEKLVRFGMPPLGKDRWKFLDKQGSR